MEKVLTLLKEKQDDSYGDFIHKLTPTLSRDYFLGVRVPDIRKIAGNLSENVSWIFSPIWTIPLCKAGSIPAAK